MGNYVELPPQHDSLHRKVSYQGHRNSVIIHDDHNLGMNSIGSYSIVIQKFVIHTFILITHRTRIQYMLIGEFNTDQEYCGQ